MGRLGNSVKSFGAVGLRKESQPPFKEVYSATLGVFPPGGGRGERLE
jgi:hypothetical protein